MTVQHDYRLQQTLRTWCFRCRRDRNVELPLHPAGLGRCSKCGVSLDLADNERAEQRRYLDCYRRGDDGRLAPPGEGSA